MVEDAILPEADAVDSSPLPPAGFVSNLGRGVSGSRFICSSTSRMRRTMSPRPARSRSLSSLRTRGCTRTANSSTLPSTAGTRLRLRARGGRIYSFPLSLQGLVQFLEAHSTVFRPHLLEASSSDAKFLSVPSLRVHGVHELIEHVAQALAAGLVHPQPLVRRRLEVHRPVGHVVG